MSYGRGWVSKEDGAMMKTVLITGSIALVVGFSGTLLTRTSAPSLRAPSAMASAMAWLVPVEL